MSNQMFTSVVLDKPRRIRFSNRAIYRMGTLDTPTSLSDISKPKRAFTALSQWIWACLIDDDAKALPTPEDVADAIPAGGTKEVTQALNDAIKLANPEAGSKNADSSTPSPLPASS